MSALGAFYDALYDLAEKQVRKNGEGAAPNIVPGQISDQVAEGIIDVAASMTGSNWVRPIVDAQIINPALGAAGQNVGLSFNVFGENPPIGPQMYKRDGEDIGGVKVGQAEVPVTLGSASTALLNPAGFANSLADKYWASVLLARQVDTIASLFGDPAKEIAAINISNRYNGVDSDISAAISVAHAAQMAIDSSSGIVKTDKSIPVIDASRGNVMGALDTAIAMNAGIDNAKDREEFAEFYDKKMKKEVVDEYNKSVRGSTYAEVKSFDELFTDANRGKKLSELKDTELFDASSSMGVGDLVQNAYSKVLTKYSFDTSLSPSLNRNILNFNSVVSDQGKLGNITRSVSLGVDKATSDARPLLKLGVNELQNTYGGVDKRKDRAFAAAAKSLNKDVVNHPNARGFATEASYMYYRWQTMPTFSKIFSPVGLLTGTSWRDMASWSGGLRGASVTKAGVADLLKVKQLGGVKIDVFKSKVVDLEKRQKTLTVGSKAFIKLDAEKARYNKKITWLADKRNAFANSEVNTLGWKKVDVISSKSNRFQKASYVLYALSPGAFWGGMLNGDTVQRLAWIGTGFGKNLNDQSKWSRLGKWSHKVMNNRMYRGIARSARAVGWVVNFPANMATAAMQTAQNIAREAAKKLAKAIAKKLLSEAVSAALAYLSAGVTKILEWTYGILNILTLGALDKVTQSVLRFTFQLIVGMTIGLIAFTVMGAQSLVGGVGGPQYISQNLGNGGLFAPDPGYNPVIAQGDPYGNPVDPGNTEPPVPINWDDYAQYSDNACPIQLTNGTSVTSCSQGPNGTYSHHGSMCGASPCNYAIDMAPGNVATQVVAPSDGKAVKSGIRCMAGGTVIGITFTANTGEVYKFYHVVIKPELDGASVTKGTVLGAMIVGPSTCSSGSHVHFEVWKGGSLDPRPDAAYSVMCNLGGWTCTAN